MPPPSYQDGLASLAALTALCLNNAVTYICFGFTPSIEASQKKFVNQSGEPIGSDTRTGHTEGTLALQLDLAADPLPQPGFIYNFRGEYYIGGKVDAPYESHNVVKVNQGALKAVAPIITTLLSSVGQRKDVTIDSAGGAYALAAPTAVNTRAGATLAWSFENAPAGMTINAATGAIAWAVPIDGTYLITVKLKDSVAGEKDITGAGFLKLTVT